VIVTKDDIKEGLREVGLKQGDVVMVHSSLSSFGYVEGGPDAVIDALLETVGPEGTVMVPTFSSGDSEPFDPRTSPSRVGRTTEVFRIRKEAVRSLHPTHSVAAIGWEAIELTKDHDKTSPLGKESPLDRLVDRDGSVLLLGAPLTTNSTVHVGEIRAGVPYGWERDVKVRDRNGKVREVHLAQVPGHSGAFGKIEKPLRARGAIREMEIGGSLVRLMRARDIIEVTMEMLKRDTAALLCDDPNCARCRGAREQIAQV